MRDFRNYDIWQDGIKLTVKIYKLSETYPEIEKFNLRTQINRASTSITNNIAEGSAKSSEKDFSRFLEISLGSAFEVENLLFLSLELNYLSDESFKTFQNEINSLQKRIHGFIQHLRK